MDITLILYLAIYLPLLILYGFLMVYTGRLVYDRFFQKYLEGFPSGLATITKFLIGFYTYGLIFFLTAVVSFDLSLGLLLPSAVIGALLALTLVHAVLHGGIRSLAGIKLSKWHLLLLGISLAYWVFIVFNYNGINNFGFYTDAWFHTSWFVEQMVKDNSLPYYLNDGEQCALIAPAVLLPYGIKTGVILSYLAFGFVNMAIILFIPYLLCKSAFKLDDATSLATSIVVASFGALGANPSIFYLGFMSIAPQFYFSDTQFFSLTAIMLSTVLIYYYFVTNNRRYITLSIVLLVASFFIKPFGYMIMGPFILALLAVKALTDRKQWLAYAKQAILLAAPVALYTLAFRTYVSEYSRMAIGSLGFIYLTYFKLAYPIRELASNDVVALFVIVLCSLAGLILPLAFGRLGDKKENIFPYGFMAPLFLAAVLFSLIFVERGKFLYCGNMTWIVGLVGCSFLPFIVRLALAKKNQRSAISAILSSRSMSSVA